MSKIPAFNTDDANLNSFVALLRGLFQKLDRDNFEGIMLEGTTSADPDSEKKFQHNRSKVPKLVWLLEGDVYIPKGGLGPQAVDVRSRLTNHSFKLFISF
jgi:hypothetical protein